MIPIIYPESFKFRVIVEKLKEDLDFEV